MKSLNILVIGSGGREHALVWKLAQSPRAGKIFAAPGNEGTAQSAENISISVGDHAALIDFALKNDVGLTVVGPEVPLANGIVDAFQAADLPIFGPTQAAAQLEASKAFSKQFMKVMRIPSADYAIFTDCESAMVYLRAMPERSVVVKASGLAAGKGVIVCDAIADAEAAVRDIMVRRHFGDAGDVVVIEERLRGPEVSLLAFTDGKTIRPMVPARDHKRAFEGDMGPNTGGMGVYAPPPDIDADLVERITRTVLQPTVEGMAARGTPYVGVLYAGVMLTDRGPQVLEFNCRFGDPETQAILPLLDGDLVEIMLACIDGRLDEVDVKVHDGACATVVLASPGYPAKYPKGLPIKGIEIAEELDQVKVFHAGTARSAEGKLVTNGGRVLAVSAYGDSLEDAVSLAYAGVSRIEFDGMQFRNDIGR
jgi:phosphoribosylamine--glycine ligase